MDEQETIETARIENESKTPIDWNMWDVITSVALLAFIVTVPLGGLEYLDGRFNIHWSAHSFFRDSCIIGLIVLVSTVAFFIISAVRLVCSLIRHTKKRYTNRKRAIRIAQIAIHTVFATSFVVSVFTPVDVPLWQPGYKPFIYGFRERIRSEVDIEDVRDWLKTRSKENCDGKQIAISPDPSHLEKYWPESPEWPDSFKVCCPRFAYLDLDENGNPKVELRWGGFLGHWGVEIGMEDMEIPPSDFKRYGEYRLPLARISRHVN